MNSKLKEYFQSIEKKKILIQGLGLNGGGLGTANFFLENGFNVKITDLKSSDDLKSSLDRLENHKDKIELVLGEHREKDFADADLVVKGPGIPPDNKYIKTALDNGAYITSDLEIFFKITSSNVYAVTGSKGKSTIVSAIYEILKQKSKNSFLGGNITISPLTFYKELNDESFVILEMSSWQLRDLRKKEFCLKGCAITNLMNDHQNYYANMNDYLLDKVEITKGLTENGFCLIPYNDNFIKKDVIDDNINVIFFSDNDNGADLFYENGIAYFKKADEKKELFAVKDIQIPGDHMRYNLLIASGFCYLSGVVPEHIKKGIMNFKGAPYRLELIREWNGIKFINDTTATIPEAADKALRSFKEPIIWIAGGNDKNLDFDILKDAANIPKHIFLLSGNGTDKMKKYINRNDMEESDSLDELFEKAINCASKGDIILLSPGCASFGLFRNEFHRGDVFNKLVKSLK